jgi:hypothetical protein
MASRPDAALAQQTISLEQVGRQRGPWSHVRHDLVPNPWAKTAHQGEIREMTQLRVIHDGVADHRLIPK